MTDRRVSLNLTFATDVQPHHLLMRVIACLPDEHSARLTTTSVHAFDLAETGAEDDDPRLSEIVGVTLVTPGERPGLLATKCVRVHRDDVADIAQFIKERSR